VADIFQEVDDEVRQDRLNKAWKKYAPVLIGLAILIVLATAGYTGWRQYVSSQRLKASDALIAAMTQAGSGDRTGAIKALDALAVDAREPYATLARLRAAELRADGGDRKGAASIYAEVARTTEDKDIRQLAEVLGAVQEVPDAAPDDAIAKLKPLADAGGPWHNVAREYLGFVYFKKGDIAQARQTWQQIAQDVEASDALKARANELLSATSGEPAKAPPAPVAPPAAPAAAPSPASAVAPATPAAPPSPTPPPTPSGQPDTKGKN
jgi:hypothetical protein